MHWDKLLTIFLFGLFLVSFASAWEWDNHEYYDEETDTYTIKDTLLGIPTTTVSEITRIKTERIGATKVNLYFDYILYEDNYENPFKYIKLDKYIGNQWIEGDHIPFEILVKQGTEEISIPIYTESCIQSNINISEQICTSEETGSTSETRDRYIILDQTQLDAGTYSIKIELEKGIFDETDWILNLNGRELIEWDFLGNSLVGYWTFDNNERTVAYNVDNNSIENFTSITGAGKTSNSFLGAYAMQFNRTENDYMNLSHDPIAGGDFSWSFWVNATNNVSEQKIMGYTGTSFGERFMEFTGGTIQFHIGNGTVNYIADGVIDANNWNFVVGTYTDGEIRIYANNDNMENVTFGGTSQNNLPPFVLGAWGNPAGQFFNGTIDEFGYWNTELTPADVNILWNSGAGLTYPDPEYPGINMSLTVPLDSHSQISDSVNFNCSAGFTRYSETNILNITLLLDGISNTTVTGNSSSLELTQLVGGIETGMHNWTCIARDEENILGITTNRTFTITDFVENSQTFNASTYETSLEAFVINVSFNSSEFPVSTATLNYNGTGYTGTTSDTGEAKSYSISLNVPELDMSKNISFYWAFVLTNSTGNNYFNSTINNQSSGIINASILNKPYTIPFINFTTYDQDTLTQITSKISNTFGYGISSIIQELSYSDQTDGNSSFEYAFDPSHLDYIIEGDLLFTKSTYVDNNYVLLQQTITNATTNISIYLLNSSRSTSFIIQLRDSAFDNVAGAVIESQRFYPSTNTWVTIESFKTNIEGKTIGHFIIEDVNYRFLVYVDTVLVLTSTPTLVFCEETPCTINLQLPSGSEDPFGNSNPLDNYVSSLSYEPATETFTFSYTDTDSSTQGGRLRVVQTNLGVGSNVEICNDVAGSGTGILTCDISSETNGTYIASGYSNRTTDENKITERIGIAKIRDVVSEIGIDGILWSAIFFVSISILWLFSPAVAIVGSMFALIAVTWLGLISIPLVSLIALIFVAAILLWVITR